ncbi:choice-of-anchor D domain-containing protein [uncultured Muriicola sp.]|uniref:choice-of-anchor D domain-containing protein n=1 Tax=uncultured Muriicola sp. TaxID=1583102 RepID=UPI0026225979|nr:choice-of-anchor D domain-containing protein [uncultured Muriicola sp.]
MKPTLFLVLSLLFLVSCNKSEETTVKDLPADSATDIGNPPPGSGETNDPYEPVSGVIRIDVAVELPANTTFTIDDLAIFSLLNEDVLITDNQAKVEVLEGDGLELIFATNSDDNIVLMSYINPTRNLSLVLNSHNTALALVLMHFSMIDFSSVEREAFVAQIEVLPEFIAFVSVVEENINLGNLAEVDSQPIIDLLDLQTGKTTDKIDFTKDPLFFDVNTNMATVQNTTSEASYGVSLYSFTNLNNANNSILLDKNDSGNLDIPDNGNWVLSASNGLLFNDKAENTEAGIANSGKLFLKIVSLYSSTLSSALGCGGDLGLLFYNETSYQLKLEKWSNNEITTGELIFQTILYARSTFDKINNVFQNCLPNLVGNSPMGAFYKFLGLYSKALTINSTVNLIRDWLSYPAAINLQFVKNEEDISFYEGLFLTGSLNFGEVLLGATSEPKPLELLNNIEKEIVVSGITLPAGVSIASGEWSSGTIEAGQSVTTQVLFSPDDTTSFNEIIEVENDADQENNSIGVTGIGVIPLVYASEIDFGNVRLNEDSIVAFQLNNENNIDVIISNISFQNPAETAYVIEPSGFTGGVIGAGQSSDVLVKFTPDEDRDFDNVLLISFDAGGVVPLNIPLSGNGFVAPSIVEAELDFGDVVIGETPTINLTIISNDLDSEVSISSVGFLIAPNTTIFGTNFTGDLVIPANSSSSAFSVQFVPDIDGSFQDQLEIKFSETDDIPYIIPITGRGVLDDFIELSSDLLEFGSVDVGSSPAPLTLTISNISATEDIIIDNINPSTIYPTPAYKITYNNAEISLLSIPKGTEKTITIEFTPTTAGNYPNIFSLIYYIESDAGRELPTKSFNVTGIATQASDLMRPISPILQIRRPNEVTPLVVEVTDSYGNAVVGQEVFWRTTGLDSSISASSITDSNGEATATWTLGTYYDESIPGEIIGNGAYPYIIDASGNEIQGPTVAVHFQSVRIYVSAHNVNNNPISGSVIFEIGGSTGTFTVTDGIITGGTPHLAYHDVRYWLSFADFTSVEGTITTSFNRFVNMRFEIDGWDGGSWYRFSTSAYLSEGWNPNQTFPFTFTVY